MVRKFGRLFLVILAALLPQVIIAMPKIQVVNPIEELVEPSSDGIVSATCVVTGIVP